MVQCEVTHFNFWTQIISLEWLRLEILNIYTSRLYQVLAFERQTNPQNDLVRVT